MQALLSFALWHILTDRLPCPAAWAVALGGGWLLAMWLRDPVTFLLGAIGLTTAALELTVAYIIARTAVIRPERESGRRNPLC